MVRGQLKWGVRYGRPWNRGGGERLIWYGACNGGPGVVRNVPNPAQNFPPIHTSDMSISSQTNRSSDRLYQVYKRYGGVLLRF